MRCREKRKIYQTNRSIKGISLYVYFKNITIAGYINNPENQIQKCLDTLNISRATYYNYLNYAKELGLIEVQKNRLRLVSWQHLCSMLHINTTRIKIDYDNTKTKLEHVLTTIEIQQSQDKQQREVERKLTQTPIVKEAYYEFCKAYNLNAPFSLENLWKAQQIAFRYGVATGTYQNLFLVNPDLNRSNKKLASDQNLKSRKLATYTKRKLVKCGLIEVTKRSPVCCIYGSGIRKITKRGYKDKAFTFYAPKDTVNRWFLTDHIALIAPKIGIEESK